MKMHNPVYVAGAGIISAIGNNIAECINALENNRTGISAMQYLSSIHEQTLPVGEVKKSNTESEDASRH